MLMHYDILDRKVLPQVLRTTVTRAKTGLPAKWNKADLIIHLYRSGLYIYFSNRNFVFKDIYNILSSI